MRSPGIASEARKHKLFLCHSDVSLYLTFLQMSKGVPIVYDLIVLKETKLVCYKHLCKFNLYFLLTHT